MNTEDIVGVKYPVGGGVYLLASAIRTETKYSVTICSGKYTVAGIEKCLDNLPNESVSPMLGYLV